jgi:hypothetical protein
MKDRTAIALMIIILMIVGGCSVAWAIGKHDCNDRGGVWVESAPWYDCVAGEDD